MLSARMSAAFCRFADRPALRIGDRTFTYNALRIAASSIQAALAQGPPVTSVVGVLAERSVAAFAGALAAALGRHTYLPLNPSYPQRRLHEVIKIARSGVIITDSRRAALARELLSGVDYPGALVVVADTGRAQVEPMPIRTAELRRGAMPSMVAPELIPPPVADIPLYLMFTSGTTGSPKGIAIGRAQVSAYLDSITRLFDFSPNDRFSQFFNLSFDLSVHDMFVAWTHGACVYVPSDVELIDPVSFSRRHNLSVWFSVPSLASLAIRSRRLRPGSLPALRHALFCGEALSGSVAERFAQAAPNAALTNLYGPTEATIAITSHRVSPACVDDPSHHEIVPIGHPFPGQEHLVLDAEGVSVPKGELGELWLAGSQLSSGYINNPVQSKAKFRHFSYPHRASTFWYATGDLVTEHLGVGLVYRGRKDDQIKLHGHRIELDEVEEVLRVSADVPLSIVVPWAPNGRGTPETLIAVVCSPHRPASEILDRMRQRLPPFMIPSEVVSVSKLEFNANHKLDRKSIVEQLLQSHR